MNLKRHGVVLVIGACLAILASGSASATTQDRSLRNFHNPSGAVRCAINAQRVVCARQNPNRAVRILAGKKAERRSYVGLPEGAVLQYGQTATVGRFSCTSSAAGIRCRDRRTGHAFRISRLRIELLPKRQPVRPPTGGAGGGGGACNPNYSGACVPNNGSDVDCSDIPDRGFRVVGTDVYNLDSDGDGIACES